MELTRRNTRRIDKLRFDTESHHIPVYNTLTDLSACVQNGEGTCDLLQVAYTPTQLAVVDDSPLQHTISFEQDPSCAERIRTLLARKRTIKRQRRAAIQRFFPRVKRPDGTYYCPRYEWYVRHFTRPYWVRKFDGMYLTYSLPYYRWINTGRLIDLTYTEYAEHMLDELPHSNRRARRFWQTRLEYYRTHPRLGNSRYPKKWWEKTGGYWFVVDPGGHPIWKKRFKSVRYHYRDWPRIRQGWLTYRAAAIKAIDQHNARLAVVEQQLADASRGISHFNACDAYADGGESLTADPQAQPRMLGFRPSDGDRTYPIWSTPFRGVQHFQPADFLYMSDIRLNWWIIDRHVGYITWGSDMPSEQFLSDPENWINTLGARSVPLYDGMVPGESQVPCFASFVRYDSSMGDFGLVALSNLSLEYYYVEAWRYMQSGPRWIATVRHYVPDRGFSQRFHMSPSTRRAPLALDVKSGEFSGLIEDKTREGMLALLALRPDQAEIALNLTRSIGELKDLPKSVQSGAEFLRWTQAVASTRGHPHARYWEIQQHFGGGRTVTWVSKSPPSRAFIRKHAKILPNGRIKPGSLTVIKRQATRRTGMATLSALYLAWKFGVEQTLNDGNIIARHGWDWVLQVRRGLNIMLHRFRTITRFITLRTVRNVSDLPWTGPIGSVSEIPYSKEFRHTGNITDRIDLTRVYTAIKQNDGAPIDFAEIQLSPDTTVSIPCILSEHHKFAFEDPRYYPGGSLSIKLKDGSYLSRALCLDLLELFNERQLWDILSEQEVVPRAELYQRARIVCFARYKREQLKRAVDSKHARNWFAWSQLTNTAWELFPCSFVIDWFVTTRQWVQSITDAIATWSTNVYPHSKLWTSIRNRIWYTPLENIDISGAAQLESGGDTECIAIGTSALHAPHDAETEYAVRAKLRVLRLPKTLNLSYDYSIFWDYSRIKKSHMKRFQRAPAIEKEAIALPRVRCNVKLNIGKLSSLLAMFVSK